MEAAAAAAPTLSCWEFSLDASSSTARSRGHFTAPVPLPSPPGFAFVESAFSTARAAPLPRSSSSSSHAASSSCAGELTRDEALRRQQLLAKKGWEIAMSPAKNLAMNFFMIYMGGVGGIFGIFILFYVLHSCFSSALNVQRVFAGVEKDRQTLVSSSTDAAAARRRGAPQEDGRLGALLWLQKAVYLLISLGGCLYVLTHCAKAGLLPLNSGDFIALIPEKQFSVAAVGGL
ncbi:hypothetical protein BESB_002620 [Besnoitia besnoiti]|uniref:ER membrane protein complex subunit 4 n=1 Tax=Besnoitia besnoiti TaxID=94643 RepID=A0A2A9MN50_BESBE|nr:hypothetical protein BESB_002620 [Besnoitia besnoiti]PFH37921.1 hypothetical protein BESB_002620 [Besnoitia besnoiti]